MERRVNNDDATGSPMAAHRVGRFPTGRGMPPDRPPSPEAGRPGSTPAADRECTVCAAGRGFPWDCGILSLARPDQRTADPGKRLLVYRGRGGLAGLLQGEPLYQRVSGDGKIRL